MKNECKIWLTPANEFFHVSGRMYEIDSPRSGGKYLISHDTCRYLQEQLNDLEKKARLTTWLVKQRRAGVSTPEITRDAIDAAKNGQPIPVSERTHQILLFFDDHVRTPSDAISINPEPQNERDRDDDKVLRFYELLAHSESVRWEDLRFMLNHLMERKLIRNDPSYPPHSHYIFGLKVPGFERVEELKKAAPDSVQVFVAMWFDETLVPAYKKGFKRAIENAGYKAFRVDLGSPSLDKLDDRIISEIRRSRFVVADFSKGNDGARGSVYYEAGFAHGLGRKVIFTCRKEDIEGLHFDTRQYPHIVWEDENDLRKQLQERITALMGDGPYRGSG